MTGIAEKTTLVPGQTGLAEGVIDTLTGNNGLTVMVKVFVDNGPPHVPVAFCNCL